MIFAQSDATFRLSAASVHRHHELAISAVAFIPIFTELGSDVLLGGKRIGERNAGVSFF